MPLIHLKYFNFETHNWDIAKIDDMWVSSNRVWTSNQQQHLPKLVGVGTGTIPIIQQGKAFFRAPLGQSCRSRHGGRCGRDRVATLAASWVALWRRSVVIGGWSYVIGENAEFLAGPAGQALGLAGDAVRQREDGDAVQTDRPIEREEDAEEEEQQMWEWRLVCS